MEHPTSGGGIYYLVGSLASSKFTQQLRFAFSL